MVHNLEQVAQACGVILPISILFIRNEDDRNLIIQVYTDYRFLMYRIARHYFGSNERPSQILCKPPKQGVK